MEKPNPALPEPWLRGSLQELPAVPRAVLHALESAKEDLWKWCFPLSSEQLHQQAGELASVAFHLRHVARSLDRLLTYAEGHALGDAQLAILKSEAEPGASHDEVFSELSGAFRRSEKRVRQLANANFESPRSVGKKQLPTTLGGLLVHVADHTMRHVGQAIITAKVVAKR